MEDHSKPNARQELEDVGIEWMRKKHSMPMRGRAHQGTMVRSDCARHDEAHHGPRLHEPALGEIARVLCLGLPR